MTRYTKIYGELLLTSSIWTTQTKEARILWVTMLSSKNKDQVVTASLPGLARLANLTLPETQEALEVLKAPDPFSRTKDEDGRKIVEVTGGWKLLNGKYYDDLYEEERKREDARVRQSIYREKKEKTNGVEMPEIPDILNTLEFESAWEDWQQHRREKHQKLTPMCAKEQLKKLSIMGVDRAISTIRHSISGGWQGLFEPKVTAQGYPSMQRERPGLNPKI